MKTILTLILPRFYSAVNNLRPGNKGNSWIRVFIFGLIGLVFWIGIFIIFYKVLFYFRNVEDFGNILAMKLLAMIILTFFALLVFSNIVNSLSHLYLSHDLTLVHSLPVSGKDIFFSRWLISTFDSSWMVVAFSLPVFLSYGIIYKAGFFYYLIVLATIVFMCLITSASSSILVLLCAIVLPAGRIRTIIVMLGFVLFLVLILVMRMARPEQLVNPDSFASVVLYLNSMQTPDLSVAPTTWLIDSVKASLNKEYGIALFNIALAGSFAFMIIFFSELISSVTYFEGFSKSQTTPQRLFSPVQFRGMNWETLLNFLPREARAFAIKEIRTFFRDSTQWPQLFLMGALIAIYLFNFSVLPWDKSPIKAVYVQNLFSFLNMGLAAFVLSALAARFVYPAVSMEGAAFWIVEAAPVSLKTFLWIKFFLYYFPLLIMAEILIVVSNVLLQVSLFMMILSAVTIFFLVLAIVAMGIGLGAIYPNFKSENPAQIVTGFGGLLFMILSFALIAIVIILEAGPTYYVFMANVSNKPLAIWQIIWLIGSFAFVCGLCLAAIFYPMRLGIRSLTKG